jgi:hypothetical protein
LPYLAPLAIPPPEPADPGSNSDKKGIYIGLISFAGDTYSHNTSTTISNFYYLDSSGKSSIQSSLNSNYYLASQSSTALYYAVHKALANLRTAESALPSDIQSVNLITFTDGLDNASFGASNTSPIEGKSGVLSTDYATYVKEEIASRTIGGKLINAYSIGVKGSDVSDEAAFSVTLSNIASSPANVSSLNDMDELQTRLTEIAKSINIVKKVSFKMTTPQGDPGTVIRMTFGVSGTSPADAAAATRYIDGTLAYTNGTWSLINIQYSSGITSDSGTVIAGTASGSVVSFTFNNITGYSSSDEVKQWIKAPQGLAWQLNSEYSESGASSTDVDTSLIYLVLDKSTSLEDYQIYEVRAAVQTFIDTLYDLTQ